MTGTSSSLAHRGAGLSHLFVAHRPAPAAINTTQGAAQLTGRRQQTVIMKLALAFLGATAVAFTAPQTTSTRGLYPVVCVASAHHKYSGKLNLHESLGGADARHATVAAPGKDDEVRDRI